MAVVSEQIAHAELVGGGATVLHSHAGAPPGNVKAASEATADPVTNAEVLLLSAPAITVSGTNRVAINAYCEAVKDGGTTSRTAGIRVRRGTLTSDPLVAESRHQLVGVASTPGNIAVCAVNSPGAGTYTYGLFGFNGNFTISYEDKALVVMEIGP